MSTPMGADRLLKALRDEGLRVVEHRSWRTHNRNHKGPFGPMFGVMIHHTVTRGDTPKQTADSVELCYNGHASLPGPLCQGVIAKDGTVHLVGNGRCNHAGMGDDDVLRAVISQSALPPDNEANTDGNRHFYGFEAINLGDGKDPWPASQLDAIEKAAAAVCRVHGWSYRSVIGHKEWQPGKIDPLGFTMDSMRARIDVRLKGSTPKPPPEEDVSLTKEQADQLSWLRKYAGWPYTGTGDTADAFAYLRGTNADVKTVGGKVNGLVQTAHSIAEAIDGLSDVELTLEQLDLLAEKIIGSPVFLEALAEATAEKVATKLAARLES